MRELEELNEVIQVETNEEKENNILKENNEIKDEMKEKLIKDHLHIIKKDKEITGNKFKNEYERMLEELRGTSLSLNKLENNFQNEKEEKIIKFENEEKEKNIEQNEEEEDEEEEDEEEDDYFASLREEMKLGKTNFINRPPLNSGVTNTIKKKKKKNKSNLKIYEVNQKIIFRKDKIKNEEANKIEVKENFLPEFKAGELFKQQLLKEEELRIKKKKMKEEAENKKIIKKKNEELEEQIKKLAGFLYKK